MSVLACPKERTMGVNDAAKKLLSEIFDPQKVETAFNEMSSEQVVALKARIEKILRNLKYREREIIKRHYGWGYGCTSSLRRIAKGLKISDERVRQIKNEAIIKFQRPARLRDLERLMCGRQER